MINFLSAFIFSFIFISFVLIDCALFMWNPLTLLFTIPFSVAAIVCI